MTGRLVSAGSGFEMGRAGPGRVRPPASGCVPGYEGSAGAKAWRPRHTALREPRAYPPRCGGEPGRAMFGRERFIVRVGEDAVAPRVRVGGYVWFEADEPAAHGRLVADCDPGRSGEAVVRVLLERGGRRTLHTLDGRCPERTIDAGNETDIRGALMFVGNTV